MLPLYIAILLLVTSIPAPLVLSQTQTYNLNTKFQGNDFFDGFRWETMDDPTHGRTNFVDQETAQNTNLSYANPAGAFMMKADNHSIVSPGPSSRGRDSIRITSYKCWGDSLIIIDLEHMPAGCATWPAFWTSSQRGPWPNGGEIDMIEGVNTNSNNLASLHTTPNCSITPNQAQKGSIVSTNCDSSVNYNQGCGVASNTPNSYGGGFNNNDGGYFATWRSPNGISMWFWPRNAPNVPPEISQGDFSGMITPANPSWGTPDSNVTFQQNCDYYSHFDCHEIIFDLTFCGDWAGSSFSAAGCGPNCEDFVNNNPEAFQEAYWEVNALRIYTPS